MGFDENFEPLAADLDSYADSMNEAAAHKQMALDLVYGLVHGYDMSTVDAMALCGAVGVNWDEFVIYTGVPK